MVSNQLSSTFNIIITPTVNKIYVLTFLQPKSYLSICKFLHNRNLYSFSPLIKKLLAVNCNQIFQNSNTNAMSVVLRAQHSG